MILKSYVLDQKIHDAITENIPQKLIRVRSVGQGGKSINLSYLTGYTVTKMLDHVFGHMWEWKDVECWIEDAPEDKYGNVGKVCQCRGALTVYLLDENNERIPITRVGYGSKICLGGTQDQQSVYKAASTDALKKAASYFGIGAALYLHEEEVAAFNELRMDNPWTPELKEKYKKEWDELEAIMKECGATKENVNAMLLQWTSNTLGNIDFISPENLGPFIKFLKEGE